MPVYFARALDQIRALAPDLLVVSGDLVDFPLDKLDDPEALALGRQDLELIRGLLVGFPAPIVVVAGNHDDPQGFADLFGSYPSDQTVAGYRVLTFHDAEGPGNVPVRTGLQAARFSEALAGDDPTPQIHIQHYVVWPECNEEYPCTYGVGAAMRTAITAAGNVRLVLSGHYHRGVKPFFEKGTWFAVAPAFGEAPHPFWVYDLEGDELTHRTYTLDL